MPNNPNTDNENESASLDAEDWEIALKPYFGYPDGALDLARNLMTIRECLKTTPPDVPAAVAALNESADSLFPLTNFRYERRTSRFRPQANHPSAGSSTAEAEVLIDDLAYLRAPIEVSLGTGENIQSC